MDKTATDKTDLSNPMRNWNHPFINSSKNSRISRDAVSLQLVSLMVDNPENFKEHTSILNHKEMPLKLQNNLHRNVTYRKLTNWIKLGLLSPAQKEEGDWKRWSFLDNIW